VARKQRLEFAGAIFHVYVRRVERRLLYVDDDDYARYIALLERTVEAFDWILLSFCLMPTHVHLLVELREPNLGQGMKFLHEKYVRWYNDRHTRPGRLFEHRYGAKLVDDDLYFLTVVDYIEANPVSAGLCTKPDGWRWSSRGIVASGARAQWLACDLLTSRLNEIGNRKRSNKT
jgi:REP element-mobilizing transposase RayT